MAVILQLKDTSEFHFQMHNADWKIAVLVRILELMHEALMENKIVSKRNIYYQDPALFQRQEVVNRYVDILANTFGLNRLDLNVTAAAKGLVAGHITYADQDGSTVNRGEDGNAHLVIDSSRYLRVSVHDAKWILVIEKESTFRTFVSSKVHENRPVGKGIIITAKGFPDLSTRALLSHLSQGQAQPANPPPPILMLADYDPYGISIMSTYKYGSQKLVHESEHLRLPRMHWLGIQSSDVHSNILQSHDQDSQGLLSLTIHDRKRAAKMLENNVALAEDGAEKEWRREVQVMLLLGVKAEMEILERGGVDLSLWFSQKMSSVLEMEVQG